MLVELELLCCSLSDSLERTVKRYHGAVNISRVPMRSRGRGGLRKIRENFKTNTWWAWWQFKRETTKSVKLILASFNRTLKRQTQNMVVLKFPAITASYSAKVVLFKLCIDLHRFNCSLSVTLVHMEHLSGQLRLHVTENSYFFTRSTFDLELIDSMSFHLLSAQ